MGKRLLLHRPADAGVACYDRFYGIFLRHIFFSVINASKIKMFAVCSVSRSLLHRQMARGNSMAYLSRYVIQFGLVGFDIDFTWHTLSYLTVDYRIQSNGIVRGRSGF
jgi:hypothetical protein